jgi:thioredoxin reductase
MALFYAYFNTFIMESTSIHKSIIIIGAGWSGVGVAGSLASHNIDDYIILEQKESFGGFWREFTYDSVRMHDLSRLWQTPTEIAEKYKDQFLNRIQVTEYLREYAEYYKISTKAQFNFQVTKVDHIQNFGWQISGVNTVNKTDHTYTCTYLCIATSYCRVPFIPSILKESKQIYQGQIMHSAHYKNPQSFSKLPTGSKILIIGGGHSASEIGTELADSGFKVVISYRSGQYFMRQSDWTTYLEQQTVDKAMKSWDCCMADAHFTDLLYQYNTRFSSLLYEINEEINWPKPDLPPASFLVLHKKTFIDDPHFFEQLERGKITAMGPVERICTTGAKFVNGECLDFDGIMLCTGFRPGLDEFLANAESYTSLHRFAHLPPEKFPLPLTDGRCKSLVKPNLFFPGFDYGINQRVDFAVYSWHVGEQIVKDINLSRK